LSDVPGVSADASDASTNADAPDVSNGSEGSSPEAEGGPVLTSCPEDPRDGEACAGTFLCDPTCACPPCCGIVWQCFQGKLAIAGYSDACMNHQPDDCLDGSADGADSGGAACTPGADQTCNDNPAISSLHGHCTDAGTCECRFDGGVNPTTGRCL
jgi:hypothetical protein